MCFLRAVRLAKGDSVEGHRDEHDLCLHQSLSTGQFCKSSQLSVSRWHCHSSQAFSYIRNLISLAWVSLNPRYLTESLLERNFVSPLCWTISSQNCIYVRSLLTGPSKEDVIQSVHWRIVFLSPLDLSQIASQREWIETGKTVQKYFCLILESGSSHIKASFLEFSTRVYVEKCVLQTRTVNLQTAKDTVVSSVYGFGVTRWMSSVV